MTSAKPYCPPFAMTPGAVTAFSEIMRLVGRYEGLRSPRPQPKLRRHNQVRTVLGSVAIEGNSLTEDHVTAILEGKRVLGSKREILEIQNAIETYRRAADFDPTKEKDLLGAHAILMKGLALDAGRYRSRGVGVVDGSRVVHVAPPAKQVPRLMHDVLFFLKDHRGTHPLVQSAVIHYELEFIHPFSDGNGRIGRLWQHVVLTKFHPVFDVLPIESVIHEHQEEYYRALAASDKAGESSIFIEFSLGTIERALANFLEALKPEPATSKSRLENAREVLGERTFSRKDYLLVLKVISTATASRDLKEGVDRKVLTVMGERARAVYRFR